MNCDCGSNSEFDKDLIELLGGMALVELAAAQSALRVFGAAVVELMCELGTDEFTLNPGGIEETCDRLDLRGEVTGEFVFALKEEEE